ncbi:TVP38/TMEM64 family protein [uncultured Christiangramia sp.]|uniref:TVP38/TMEM64 family protein n=1 Tax=Christiangramia sp. 3-2217-3z TaxID=3417564 RepID=UPI0026124A25|nr:TVP38/TMEM64 family protein [uncultured Christiangramia sp.]
MNTTSLETASVKKSKTPLYISISIVILIIGSYFFIPNVQEFLNESWNVLTSNDNQKIQNWVDGFGWFGPLLLVVCMVAQMFLLVIPSIALMVVSILAYGPVWGSFIVLVSIFTASSIGYWIGRYFGPVIVEKLIGHKSEKKIAGFLEDYGFWAVIVTRLNPFLSNDAISFVGGILKMGYWRFIGATLVGIAPLTVFIAIIGKSTDALKSGLLWGSLVSLVIFGVYIYWDKKKKKK